MRRERERGNSEMVACSVYLMIVAQLELKASAWKRRRRSEKEKDRKANCARAAGNGGAGDASPGRWWLPPSPSVALLKVKVSRPSLSTYVYVYVCTCVCGGQEDYEGVRRGVAGVEVLVNKDEARGRSEYAWVAGGVCQGWREPGAQYLQRLRTGRQRIATLRSWEALVPNSKPPSHRAYSLHSVLVPRYLSQSLASRSPFTRPLTCSATPFVSRLFPPSFLCVHFPSSSFFFFFPPLFSLSLFLFLLPLCSVLSIFPL